MRRIITMAGPSDHGHERAVLAQLAGGDPDNLGQYVEAATAAYGVYKSKKGGGGGKARHAERVAERQARVNARRQALGVTAEQWNQLSQMARAKGYTYKTHKGRSVETIVQELGGIDAVRAKFGWPPPSELDAGGGGGGIMAAGFGGGGVSPTVILAGAAILGMMFMGGKRRR